MVFNCVMVKADMYPKANLAQRVAAADFIGLIAIRAGSRATEGAFYEHKLIVKENIKTRNPKLDTLITNCGLSLSKIYLVFARHNKNRNKNHVFTHCVANIIFEVEFYLNVSESDMWVLLPPASNDFISIKEFTSKSVCILSINDICQEEARYTAISYKEFKSKILQIKKSNNN